MEPRIQRFWQRTCQAVAAMTPLVRESRSGIAAPNFVAFAQRFLLGEEEGQSLLPGVGLGGVVVHSTFMYISYLSFKIVHNIAD